nr:hypothetical protein [Tanacetum cinerariifolium]
RNQLEVKWCVSKMFIIIKWDEIENKEIEANEEPSRGIMWLEGRVNKDGEFTDDEIRSVGDKLPLILKGKCKWDATWPSLGIICACFTNELGKFNPLAVLVLDPGICMPSNEDARFYQVGKGATAHGDVWERCGNDSVQREIEADEELSHGIMWLKGRVNKDEEFTDNEIRSVGDKLIKEGTLNLDDGTDAMTVVFGKKKEGYTRGVGSGVTYKRYFHFPRSRQATDERIELLQPKLDNERCARQQKDASKCKLWHLKKLNIVALGIVYKSDGKQMLHNQALPNDCYKVSIDSSLVDATCIPDVGNYRLKTVKDGVGGFVAWPKNQVVLDEEVTPPTTIQKISDYNSAPKLQSKRKNYVSRETMQRQARTGKSHKPPSTSISAYGLCQEGGRPYRKTCYGEKESDDLLDKDREREERIKQLEADLVSKTSSFVKTEGVVNTLKGDLERLTVDLAKQRLWSEGVKAAYFKEEAKAFLATVFDYEPSCKDTFMYEFDYLFNKSYPYVEKLAESFWLPLGDL